MDLMRIWMIDAKARILYFVCVQSEYIGIFSSNGWQTTVGETMYTWPETIQSKWHLLVLFDIYPESHPSNLTILDWDFRKNNCICVPFWGSRVFLLGGSYTQIMMILGCFIVGFTTLPPIKNRFSSVFLCTWPKYAVFSDAHVENC